jgi:hypothetical protein
MDMDGYYKILLQYFNKTLSTKKTQLFLYLPGSSFFSTRKENDYCSVMYCNIRPMFKTVPLLHILLPYHCQIVLSCTFTLLYCSISYSNQTVLYCGFSLLFSITYEYCISVMPCFFTLNYSILPSCFIMYFSS